MDEYQQMLVPCRKAAIEDLRPHLCALIRYYYEHVCPVGGPLHIATDDGNLTDQDIWFCQEEAEKCQDTLASLIGILLRGLSQSEREGLYESGWGRRQKMSEIIRERFPQEHPRT